MTQNRRGGIIIETANDRMEQALKTRHLMNSCRDRSDGNSSRSSIPGSFRVLPPSPLPPTSPHTYFNYTHVVAITFHFVLLSLHSFSLSSLHCHLHPCDLCSPALPAAVDGAPGLRTTPGQPREFYAHTMKRFSHLSSHRPGPFKLSPQAESRCLRKDNEFPGKMFGLIGYGAGSGTGVH